MKAGSNSASIDPATDERAALAKMDVLLGYFLLIGVLASVALILIGLAWDFALTGDLRLDYRLEGMNLFQLVAAEARLAADRELEPRFFINIGISLLMFTPFLRVLLSVLYFALALRNWKYTLITSIVLAVLTFSLFLR